MGAGPRKQGRCDSSPWMPPLLRLSALRPLSSCSPQSLLGAAGGLWEVLVLLIPFSARLLP